MDMADTPRAISTNMMAASAATPAIGDCSPAEWEARVELAIAYRLLAWLGISDLIHTHISVQVPGRADQFLQLPYGLLFDEARASDMAKIDVAGAIISDPTGLGISRGGFGIHSAIHVARPDALCVVHAHSEATIAVATMTAGLLPLTQHAQRFHDRIAYFDYCGMFETPEKLARLAPALGDSQVLMLRNHGPLVVGASIPQAFSRLYYLERACRMQVAMLSAVGGARGELSWPDPADCALVARAFDDPSQSVAQREWAALRRMLDRDGARYAD